MIHLKDIHSLSDFQRNTKDFVQQIAAQKNPVVLTVNGKAKLVVQDAEAYQELLDKVDRLETIEGIKRGFADVEVGRTRSLAEFDVEMLAKYGLPHDQENLRHSRLTELRSEIEIGVKQMERGECTEYNAETLQNFAEEIKAAGQKKQAASVSPQPEELLE